MRGRGATSTVRYFGREVPREAMDRLWTAAVPAPVIAPNLLWFRDRDWYRVYGMAVLPLLAAVGGRPIWISRHAASIFGEPQADVLLLVRYPSHRSFLRMTRSRAYAWVNRARERGTARLELSLTSASPATFDVGPCRVLVGVHHAPSDDDHSSSEITEAIERRHGRLVSKLVTVADVDLFDDGHRPSDPRPLALPHILFFAFPDVERAREAMTEDVLATVRANTRAAAVHAYERMRVPEMVPSAGMLRSLVRDREAKVSP